MRVRVVSLMHSAINKLIWRGTCQNSLSKPLPLLSLNHYYYYYSCCYMNLNKCKGLLFSMLSAGLFVHPQLSDLSSVDNPYLLLLLTNSVRGDQTATEYSGTVKWVQWRSEMSTVTQWNAGICSLLIVNTYCRNNFVSFAHSLNSSFSQNAYYAHFFTCTLLWKYFMAISPDVIPCGWLGLKHQLTKNWRRMVDGEGGELIT